MRRPTLAVVLLVWLTAALGCSDRTLRREGETDLQWGERLFAHLGCVTCHSLSGARLQGPPVGQEWLGEVKLRTGETVIRDERYLRESIIDPQAQIREDFFPVMVPTTGLSEQQLDVLVAYLREQAISATKP